MFTVSLSKNIKQAKSDVIWDVDSSNIREDIFKYSMFDVYLNKEMSHWNDRNLDELLDWCKENCEGKYGFTVYNEWHFSKETDAILFTLKWK